MEVRRGLISRSFNDDCIFRDRPPVSTHFSVDAGNRGGETPTRMPSGQPKNLHKPPHFHRFVIRCSFRIFITARDGKFSSDAAGPVSGRFFCFGLLFVFPPKLDEIAPEPSFPTDGVNPVRPTGQGSVHHALRTKRRGPAVAGPPCRARCPWHPTAEPRLSTNSREAHYAYGTHVRKCPSGKNP